MTDKPATARYPRQVPVDAYGNGGFRFAEMSHIGSLLCLPSGIYAWDENQMDGITFDAFAPLLKDADKIDVLLVGTGETQIFLASKLLHELRNTGLIVEAMATGAAARTYNVLLAEDRFVAAALIAVGDPPVFSDHQRGS